MQYTKFYSNRLSGSEELFDGFGHIWALRIFWSYDQDRLNECSFPYSKEALYEF